MTSIKAEDENKTTYLPYLQFSLGFLNGLGLLFCFGVFCLVGIFLFVCLIVVFGD